MEHLIDLIRSEFELAQYSQLTDYIWRHREYDDFWVIQPINGDYDLEQVQEDIFNSLAALRKDFPASEKSMSLLILQELDSRGAKTPQQVIADENNVYYFKKYVIQYTEEEWNAVKALIPANGHGLGELLMQTEVFEQVKHGADSANHLLYTVAHKLPFIMMHAERRPYDPNPTITVDAALERTFERIENIRDMEGRNASDEEIAAASALIDQWINEDNDEQHQD